MYKPALHSHTHCQAEQAHATAHAWRQRVYVQPESQNTQQTSGRKEQQSHTFTITQAAVSCLEEHV